MKIKTRLLGCMALSIMLFSFVGCADNTPVNENTENENTNTTEEVEYRNPNIPLNKNANNQMIVDLLNPYEFDPEKTYEYMTAAVADGVPYVTGITEEVESSEFPGAIERDILSSDFTYVEYFQFYPEYANKIYADISMYPEDILNLVGTDRDSVYNLNQNLDSGYTFDKETNTITINGVSSKDLNKKTGLISFDGGRIVYYEIAGKIVDNLDNVVVPVKVKYILTYVEDFS